MIMQHLQWPRALAYIVPVNEKQLQLRKLSKHWTFNFVNLFYEVTERAAVVIFLFF